MHVLTTDLDRTLIFSARSVGCALEDVLPIEMLDGRAISYTNVQMWQLIEQLEREHMLIPVTSRSSEQYARIDWPLYPRIAIVANGGIVLRDGLVDAQWRAQMDAHLTQVASLVQIAALLPADAKRYDELYFVCQADAQLDETVLNQLGWTSYVNGRKRYVMPHFLTKERAVSYVLSTLAYTHHFAAGDSVMDVPMLKLAHTAFAPKNSEAATILPMAASKHDGLAFAASMLQQIIARK